MPSSVHSPTVMVLGATGYVGGRLVFRLLEAGYSVRACGRSIEKLKGRVWSGHPGIELAEADVLKPESLACVLKGCGTVYYLVHSMNASSKDFEESDRRAATIMKETAAACGVGRIIYLSGLSEGREDLSKHLQSRSEVARILRSGPVPVTVLRAAMIIGSGSASFEILRYLVERLPVMITPRWVKTLNQPIAIRNVIDDLLVCLRHPETSGQSYDIGGKDVVSYGDLMRIYAEEAGLPRRLIIPVPVLTPRLSSLWIHLVTPVPFYIARPLAEGLRNEVICRDHNLQDVIPVDLLSCREAIARAIRITASGETSTFWADAGQTPVESIQPGDPDWAGGTVLKDARRTDINVSVEKVWDVITRIGGRTGWYHADGLWRLRGLLDKLSGGVGLRRGRRHPVEIAHGDVLDFWRVTEVKPLSVLRLSADMKLPGRAFLEFRMESVGEQTVFHQTAVFYPKGLWGILYWYSIWPLHQYVFGGMLRAIKARAESGRSG